VYDFVDSGHPYINCKIAAASQLSHLNRLYSK